ncbi:hypothetical protein COCON_G00015190 [Conger conger]|uniref:Ig-like domain-containing protein n=1 Tax=Conger conger TaxID=82655 RepID=A0A9Q1E3B9_CONCO|nr:hypothetical protein COCON_G00015190 [Conger conger]
MWSYHNQTSGTNIELVIEGKFKKENEKEPRKLKVGSDCSLHINNLTTADTGQYFCRLYREGSGHTDATRIFLSLLSISSSPSVTELKIGSTVTLHCQLHSHSHRPCRDSMRVTWVSETGNPLQGARYKVSETQCSSSLTLTLERSDRNMKWRCQLTEGEEQKASLSYTTSFPDENMIGVWIGSGVAICIAVVFLVILAVKYKRRKVERETAFTQDTRSDTVTNQNKGQSEDTVTYAVVNPSAAGKRKPGRKTAESETEYATINTSR